MNVYEQSIVAYALPSLYHIYYLAPVDEEYRVWSWLYQVTILVEERRGRTEVGEQSVIRGIRAGSLYVKKIPQHLFDILCNNANIR